MDNATETKHMEYRTPLGTFETWEAAAEACDRADLDPCSCIEVVR